MSEDTTPTGQTTAATGQTTQAQEVTWENSPIAAIWNPDGTPKAEGAKAFNEQGRDDLAGFALRNGQDLFTTLKTGRDAVSRFQTATEGTVRIPGEDATPEDRQAFNKSLGALDNKEDYLKSLFPENLPEGFQKDEGLASILAEHAVSSPVLTADSARELASKVIEYQQGQIKTFEEKQLEEATTNAQATRDLITAELGGTVQFEKFSEGMKEFALSKAAQDMGFQFQKGEDGKLFTENPLHAALLSDPTGLRLLKTAMEKHVPAGLPGSNVSTSATTNNLAEASEMVKKYPNGFKTQADQDRYNYLIGAK